MNIEESRCAVKALRASTGLSQQKFGQLFNIAAINIANWEQGKTKPPEYVIDMMQEVLLLRKQLSELASEST